MIETITTPRMTLVTTAFRSAAHNWVRNDENFFAYRRILIVDPPRPQSVRLAFLVSNRGTCAWRGRWRTTGLSGTIEAQKPQSRIIAEAGIIDNIVSVSYTH